MRRIYTWLWVTAWIFMIQYSAGAQILKGKVSVAESDQPIEFITVFVEGTGLGTVTDREGNFEIRDIPPGSHWLVLTGVGYSTRYERIEFSGKEVQQVAVALEKLDLFMPEVLIQAQSLTGGGAGLRQIPGAAHYISPKELARFQYSDVHRILQRVPGVNIQEEDGFGLRPNIGLRGSGVERSSKITLMEDGILMAPAPYSAPAAYYFPTIGRMQGVEVMKGGSQLRFGPYTTGGALNLISTAIPAERMARVRLQAGEFGMRQLHAAAGQQFGRIGIMAETFQLASDGFKTLPGDVNTPIGREDYLIKARWVSAPSRSWFQSVQVKMGQSSERSMETYLGLSQEDFDADPYQRYAASEVDEIVTDHQQYSVQYNLSDNRHWNIQATAYRNDFYRNWYKSDYMVDASGGTTSNDAILDDPDANERLFDIMKGADTQGSERVAVKANQRDYYAQGAQAVIGYRFARGNWKHRIDASYRYHEDAMDRFQWVDLYSMQNGRMGLREVGTPGTESNRIESARAHAAYVQYRLESDRWTIIPGMRFEDIRIAREDYGKNDPEREGTSLSERENHVQVWIPGIGVHFALNDDTDLFGGVHRGFAPPGSTPGTEPEFSINYEAGLRQDFQGGQLQVTGYYNDYTNLLGVDLLAGGGAGTQDLFNGGEATIYGLELMVNYDLAGLVSTGDWRVPGFIAYTYSHGRFDHSFESQFDPWGTVETGDELPYLAPHQLAWGLGLEYGKWALNLNGKWNDRMRTVAGQGDVPANVLIPGYHVMDISLQWQWTPNFGLSARVQNLTNEAYLVARRPAGLRPGMPRMAIFGVQWQL